MKRVFTIVSFLFLNTFAFCQWDLFFDAFSVNSDNVFSVGYSVMNHSKLPKPSQGINISYGFISEIEIKDLEIQNVFYIETNLYFMQHYKDLGGFNAFSTDSINQQSIYVPYVHKYSLRYQTFNMGMDYYYNSYTDRAFNLYVGWQLGVQNAWYFGKYELSEYDKQSFELETGKDWYHKWGHNVLNLRAGLKIGGDIQVSENVGLYFETIFSRTFKEQQMDPNFHLQGNSYVNFNFGIKIYTFGY